LLWARPTTLLDLKILLTRKVHTAWFWPLPGSATYFAFSLSQDREKKRCEGATLLFCGFGHAVLHLGSVGLPFLASVLRADFRPRCPCPGAVELGILSGRSLG
jgi:hypothetical protein